MNKLFFNILLAACIFLFVYTALSKLAAFTVFKHSLQASPAIRPISTAIAILLPLSELLVAAGLMIPAWRLKALYAFFLLMLLFTFYITAMLLWAKDLPCSCGGVIAALSWKQHLVFNGFFLLLSGIAIFLHRGPERAGGS